MIAILHNIRSLHNVGSIFRTADAAGVERLYLCGLTPGPYDAFGKLRPQLGKVSLGAEKSVAWERCGSASSSQATVRLIDRLKKDTWKIIAMELAPKALPYFRLNTTRYPRERIALVLGHEAKGLSPAILKRADTIIKIPMHGKKESLNVSVAFGVVVYGLRYPGR